MNGTLFVLDGASASGKSEIQQYVEREHPEIKVIRKVTDRRREDKAAAGAYSDQEVITQKDFDRRMENADFLWYEFSGYRYGFFLSDLERLLAAPGIFVIVRDINVIARLKAFGAVRSFPVLSAYVRVSIGQRKDYLSKKGFSDEEIKSRIERDGLRYPESRLRCPLYDLVLDNEPGNIECLYQEFENVLASYINRPTIKCTRPGYSVQ